VTTSLNQSAEPQALSIPHIFAAALGLALIGGARRGRPGTLLRVAGLGLLGFAVRPLVTTNVRRAGAARRHLDAHGSVDIERPIAEVFSFFRDFESFPRVSGRLRSVVDYQDGRSHWEAYAPSGAVMAFDVVVTKYVPRAVIAWESVPRSDIEMRGIVRFSPIGTGGTRIDVDISYRPARTAFNEAVLSLLHRRTDATLTDVLERLRFYLESLPRVIPSPVDQ
jgi:uncharacterized membrane protein